MTGELQRIFNSLEEIIGRVNISEIGCQIGWNELGEWCTDTKYGFRKELKAITRKKLMTDERLKCFDDLLSIIKDVNPKEIGSQIESDNLRVWCYSWQSEAKAMLARLAKEVDDEG